MTNQDEDFYPFADLALARRLERAEGHSSAKFIEARARLFPRLGAQWIEVAGAYAMYDGATSPLTQTFGLGMFQPVTQVEMEALERFFKERQSPVCHEISPLADKSLLPLLNQRRYQPIEFTSVMVRPAGKGGRIAGASNGETRVRLIHKGEEDMWARTAAEGWSESPELAGFLLEIGQVSAARENAFSFVAELDGKPIASGALCISGGVALLAGASTIPAARRRGAQLALLEARLNYAAECGCDIAMICAEPGSVSQRNAERHGFRIMYTRIKWRLAEDPA
jgi:hypothetical protein